MPADKDKKTARKHEDTEVEEKEEEHPRKRAHEEDQEEEKPHARTSHDEDEEEKEQQAPRATFEATRRPYSGTTTARHLEGDEEEGEEHPNPRETVSDIGERTMRHEQTLGDLADDEEDEAPSRPQAYNQNPQARVAPTQRPNYDDEEEGDSYATPEGGMDRSTPQAAGIGMRPQGPVPGQRPASMGSGFSQRSTGYANAPVFSSQKHSNGGGKMPLIILGVIGLLVIGATVYLLKGGGMNLPMLGKKATPSPSAIVQATPEPTPEPTPEAIDRSKFTVQVLNGTGKSGLAGTVTDKLKGLGYKTEKGANATNSAFKKTIIRIKPSATGLADQLVKDLAPDYQAVSEGSLKDTDTRDGEVILGAE